MDILNNNGSIMKAEDAAQIAKTSYCLANRIDKAIREAAKENICTLHWSVACMEKSVVDNVVKQLIEVGYQAKLVDDDHVLFIKWGDTCGNCY